MDILSLFANATFRDLGAVALLTFVALMIFMGRLIPKGTHLRELQEAEKRNADAVKRGDEWKQVAVEQQEVNSILRKQVVDLIEANKVVKDFLLKAGPSLGDTQPFGGGANGAP